MPMKILKHNKYKNSGIIFEILTRKVIYEVMNRQPQESLRVIKKFFNDSTEIGKEVKLYHSITEANSKIKNADKLIDVVLDTYHNTIDKNKLNEENYKLIGVIKSKYGLDKFFESRVSNYKVYASAFKLFEYKVEENPTQHVQCRDVITEHVTSKPTPDNILTETQQIWKSQSKDIRTLAFKILVEKFNAKYAPLSKDQRMILKRYISEDINSESFKKYLYSEVVRIQKVLSDKVKNVNDPIVAIKTNEAIKLLENIISSRVIKQEYVSAILKYYELMDKL
jgi:hypothetical protein